MSSRPFPTRAPNWLRQTARAAVALSLGVIVGLAAGEPQLVIAIAAIILLVFVTASLTRPDPLVFVGFAFMTMPRLHVPGSPLPLGESIMLLAVLSAFLTMKKDLFTVPRWARLALGAFVATFVLSSLINGLFTYTTFKRLLHIVVFVMVAVGLIRGLLPRKVAVRGIQVGLVVAMISGYLLLPRSTYAGRFTGFIGDPNVAGLMIVTLGAIALDDIHRVRHRVMFLALLLPALALTYSRTAFLAMMMVGVWLLIGRKLRPIPGVIVVLLCALAIALVPTSLQSVGPFSDRTGSDLLRDRVATEEMALVRQAPVLGHGAGTATVMVNYGTTRFYFHNSYLAMLQEGGIVALGLMMTLLIGSFLALMSLDMSRRRPLLEASIISVWVIAINIGEVFLELSTAVVIGLALAYVVRSRVQVETDADRRVALAS